MIDQFDNQQLENLRRAYREAGVPRFLPVDEAVTEMLAACSDGALLQLAHAGIRTLSFSAIVACWRRGIRIVRKK